MNQTDYSKIEPLKPLDIPQDEDKSSEIRNLEDLVSKLSTAGDIVLTLDNLTKQDLVFEYYMDEQGEFHIIVHKRENLRTFGTVLSHTFLCNVDKPVFTLHAEVNIPVTGEPDIKSIPNVLDDGYTYDVDDYIDSPSCEASGDGWGCNCSSELEARQMEQLMEDNQYGD